MTKCLYAICQIPDTDTIVKFFLLLSQSVSRHDSYHHVYISFKQEVLAK